jgi:cellulose synthase (UDP-forming)
MTLWQSSRPTTSDPGRHAAVRATRTRLEPDARIAGWAHLLGRPGPEPVRSRRLAHLGGLVSLLSLLIYLTWRIGFTMPEAGFDRAAAWTLIAFEALPLAGLLVRMVTLWNIDSRGPDPVTAERPGPRTVVMIPTYNEPAEVIAPTIAAACDLEPAHETWVLDDGDRPWVAELCAAYGARYLRRDTHEHAKAGNMNNALAVMAREEAAGAEPLEVIAVLDCDHVPLPTFLSDTLGWFDDPEIALVQAPQNYYNAGAFDDDGVTGEQGVFFHVLLRARNHDGAGPFWCGSTSLIRTSALRDVGGISTETIVEDMHTTLGLIRAGWKTVYHHQAVAVGLAPATAEQYLLQRRRWGMGSMQVMAHERLWAAKRWLSWRNFYEYLSGTLWWLEGVATLLVFAIPLAILFSGAQTSTAGPLAFTLAFTSMFALRMWGTRRLFRGHLHWGTAFALRIFRVPIGIACLWWLVTRRTLTFEVTPKAGASERVRGRVPRILVVLLVVVNAALLYAVAGVLDLVPWRTGTTSTIASGSWLLVVDLVLILGTRRITATDYATSRRNAHRVAVTAAVSVDGVEGELVDVSVGGLAVRFPRGCAPSTDMVEIVLPGAPPVTVAVVRISQEPAPDGGDLLSCRLLANDWEGMRTMSRWLFHTPDGAVDGMPAGVPAVAAAPGRRTPSAVKSFGAHPATT